MAVERQEETRNNDDSEPSCAGPYLRTATKLRKRLLNIGCNVTLLPTRMTAGVQLQPTTQRLLAANGTASAIRVGGIQRRLRQRQGVNG